MSHVQDQFLDLSSRLPHKGIILFELFTVFTSNMDRGLQIRDAKGGSFQPHIERYRGILTHTPVLVVTLFCVQEYLNLFVSC